MWVFFLCNALRNIGINPLKVTVARGSAYMIIYMIKTAYSSNISIILGRPCLYRSALY